MTITPKQYKKINNDRELEKSIDKLRRWFNLFIRLRDFKRIGDSSQLLDRIESHCIACGKKLVLERFTDGSIFNGKEFHASHFFNTDKYASVEFNEDNVHLSCKMCNRFLHGSKDHYQPNLIKKIGQERFDELVKQKNRAKKHNILEVEFLTDEYKSKTKVRAYELGVKL